MIIAVRAGIKIFGLNIFHSNFTDLSLIIFLKKFPGGGSEDSKNINFEIFLFLGQAFFLANVQTFVAILKKNTF